MEKGERGLIKNTTEWTRNLKMSKGDIPGGRSSIHGYNVTYSDKLYRGNL